MIIICEKDFSLGTTLSTLYCIPLYNLRLDLFLANGFLAKKHHVLPNINILISYRIYTSNVQFLLSGSL